MLCLMTTAAQERWELTRESFAQLLLRLDPDAERAAAEYEILRRRLIDFFDWRNVPAAADLADETIDRIARRLAEGERVQHLRAFAYGVARYVHLEWTKARAKEDGSLRELNARRPAPVAREEMATCLEQCLERLSESDRALILGYYSGNGKIHLDGRRSLAEQFGINYATLTTRTHRIRTRLWHWVREALEKGSEPTCLAWDDRSSRNR